MSKTIQEINKYFRHCFDNAEKFENALKTSDLDSETSDIISKKIPKELLNILESNNYNVKGSVGKGLATKSPWIAILDKDITTSTREGVYIVFLFSSDYKHVYLTLNQGTTVPGQFGPRLGKKEIAENSKRIRQLLNIKDVVLKTDGKADIADERYKEGSVYYTLWDVNNEEQGEKILNQYLEIYKRYKELTMVKNASKVTVVRQMKGFSIAPKYILYTTALRTKPFMLLAGISGTGKSRIVREMAFKTCPKYLQDKDGTTPGNYCMIEVKPNWHDSTELIGYYSNLSHSYQFKKFVKFLVKAQMNPKVPFFVCLDEMNLAPVEQYFAEILSILETRKHPKKDGEANMEIIKTEVIVESRYFTPSWKDKDNAVHEKIMSDADWYREFFDIEKGSTEETQIQKYQEVYTLRTEGLKLPDNVFIIGTVNMDDTTHQFSRKVIDRAMTIEMNGGRLSDMYGGSKDLEYIEDEKVQKEWQQAFRQYYVTADEVLDEHSEYAETLKERLPARLDELNKALKGTPFEVSYRVLNELTIMVGVMLDNKKEGEDIDIDSIIDQAVNNILLMKILPRIEGDADMFAISNDYKKDNGITHNNRLEWLMALAPDIEGTNPEEENEDTSTSKKEEQSTARKKIKEMIDRLNNQEFTRFWP